MHFIFQKDNGSQGVIRCLHPYNFLLINIELFFRQENLSQHTACAAAAVHFYGI